MNISYLDALKANGILGVNPDFSLKIDERLFPTLYHYKTRKNLFKLNYAHPYYGMQKFEFEKSQIQFAKANSKYLHTTPKDEQIDFASALKATGAKLNPILEAILSCFILNNTVLSRLPQGKSKMLKPKRNGVLQAFSFKRPKLKSNAKTFAPNVIDEELLELSSYNMSLAVQKAATSFDLDTYFPHFLEAYKDSLKAQGKSPVVSVNKIQSIFIQRVNVLNRS